MIGENRVTYFREDLLVLKLAQLRGCSFKIEPGLVCDTGHFVYLEMSTNWVAEMVLPRSNGRSQASIGDSPFQFFSGVACLSHLESFKVHRVFTLSRNSRRSGSPAPRKARTPGKPLWPPSHLAKGHIPVPTLGRLGSSISAPLPERLKPIAEWLGAAASVLSHSRGPLERDRSTGSSMAPMLASCLHNTSGRNLARLNVVPYFPTLVCQFLLLVSSFSLSFLVCSEHFGPCAVVRNVFVML